jgi:Transcriptional regulator PadR-like family
VASAADVQIRLRGVRVAPCSGGLTGPYSRRCPGYFPKPCSCTGTLYTALDRLTAEGLVELVREEIVHGRTRRSYGLTSSGAGVLRAEATRMAQAASLVTDRARHLEAGGSAREASPA